MQINFNLRNIKLILILILAVVIIKSCVFPNEDIQQDWIVIGNTSDMNHKIYDALQVQTRSANSLFIDVDDDGNNDFEFFTESTISAG